MTPIAWATELERTTYAVHGAALNSSQITDFAATTAPTHSVSMMDAAPLGRESVFRRMSEIVEALGGEIEPDPVTRRALADVLESRLEVLPKTDRAHRGPLAPGF